MLYRAEQANTRGTIHSRKADKKRKVCAGRPGLWEVPDRPMASWGSVGGNGGEGVGREEANLGICSVVQCVSCCSESRGQVGRQLP